MLSCAKLTAAQAGSYFEKEKDYYTKHQSNYDRWHGALGKARGFEGEVSKEQFDSYLDFIKSQGRETAAVDMTFSASKSVSLTMARSEADRENMIRAHQKAVDKVAHHIEQMIYTRSNKVRVRSRAMCAAEFLHLTARPSERNGFRPDLDLHSHLVVMDDTFADGKDLAIDYRNLFDARTIKELGLEYRAALAVELQNMGYELDVTDPKKGFYEIRGYDRETIEENSNRRQDILETAAEHGMTDMQAANQYSRNSKSKATADVEDVLREKHDELFASGRVRIERGETIYYGKHDNNGDNGDSGEVHDHEAPPRERGIDRAPSNERRFLASLIREGGVSKLPRLHVVQDGERVTGVLSANATDRLAVEQTARVRDYYLLGETRPERVRKIDEVAQEAVRKLSEEKFAFSVIEAQERIRAEGVLLDISKDEAAKALERQAVVELGQLKDADGKATKDRYLTTAENIRQEERIVERVKAGKNRIHDHILTTAESRERLKRIEDAAVERGETDFRISDGGEQAEAVHHIISCTDKYIAVDGLAGTGKTTLMERLKWMADEEGITVHGACFTGKAASGLEAESGIQSQTIHSFLNQLKKESGGTPPPSEKDGEIRQHWDFSRVQHIEAGQREIWAVDEAGLLGNHLMDELQAAAEARGAQVLFLGDPSQLPPVDGGQPMRAMEDAGMATARLVNIRRQKDEELLQAVKESVDGSTIKTFKTIKEKGDFHEIEKTAARRAAVVDDMTTAPLKDYKSSLLLVTTNADRKAYNAAIRARYVQKGELAQGRKYTITTRDANGNPKHESRYFAKGDRIIIRQNDRKLNVKNGMLGTVESEDGKSITIRMDNDGKLVKIDLSIYSSFDHAYAVTDYASQGMTVDRVVADMQTQASASSRNKLYVDISRARHRATIYTDNESRLEHQTMRFVKKITSKDFADRIQKMRDQGGITNNDQYHAPEIDAAAQIDKALAEIKLHTLQTKVAKPKERAAVRPQQTNEPQTKERASSSQEPNLSTSSGISRTPDQNALVESPASLSEEATRPSTRGAENPENPRIMDISEEDVEEYRKDPLEYVARRAPNETALVIEDANTITDKEFTELRQFTDKLGKGVSPFDITLARDGTGRLHVLPYNIRMTEWKAAGDRITFGQLATARHESWKLRNRFAASSVRGKCARAQYALFNTYAKGAVKGALGKGIGGLQSVASTAQDALSIFDPTTKGKDKAKAGMKQVTEAIIQTPVKIIMDIFSPPIIGILKAPFHAAGGIIKAGIGATKTAFGLMQESAERDEQQQQQQGHGALVRRK